MSNYKMQIIYSNLEVLNSYIDLVDKKVLEPYKTDIMRLPASEQKSEWYKYTLINNLITQTIETIDLMITQISTMHTDKEVQDLKQYISNLRKYIKSLGGNPTNVNNTLSTDL